MARRGIIFTAGAAAVVILIAAVLLSARRAVHVEVIHATSGHDGGFVQRRERAAGLREVNAARRTGPSPEFTRWLDAAEAKLLEMPREPIN